MDNVSLSLISSLTQCADLIRKVIDHFKKSSYPYIHEYPVTAYSHELATLENISRKYFVNIDPSVEDIHLHKDIYSKKFT